MQWRWKYHCKDCIRIPSTLCRQGENRQENGGETNAFAKGKERKGSGMYTLKEASEEYGITYTTLWQAIKKGELVSVRDANKHLVSKHDIEDFINGKQKKIT